MVFLKILVFIFGLVIGFLFLIYSEQIVRFVGKSLWFEEYFHLQGGSYLLWKLFGIIVIILGFLFLVGALDWLLFPGR